MTGDKLDIQIKEARKSSGDSLAKHLMDGFTISNHPAIKYFNSEDYLYGRYPVLYTQAYRLPLVGMITREEDTFKTFYSIKIRDIDSGELIYRDRMYGDKYDGYALFSKWFLFFKNKYTKIEEAKNAQNKYDQ